MEKHQRQALKNECTAIEDHALHTAETHHLIASKNKKTSFWFQVIPSVAAAIASLVVVSRWPSDEIVDFWIILAGIVSATVAAVGAVVNPAETASQHLAAAKQFTVLKHRARSLCGTIGECYSDDEYLRTVESLQNDYANIVLLTPPTDNKSYEKARDRIQQKKVHDHD